MYQFVYLFAPGMLAWMTKKHRGNKEHDEKCFISVIQIIVYSFVNMVAVVAVLKPLGCIKFAVLGNGSLDIQYGATGLVLSVVFAAAEGYIVTILKEFDIGKWLRTKAVALKTNHSEIFSKSDANVEIKGVRSLCSLRKKNREFWANVDCPRNIRDSFYHYPHPCLLF